ncbi:N-formylglutamate amidohydrolase [Gluconobacter thailandicus]|uniref:N-formylglutamate deformylase n=1 Tax=Gluconobacter thailandicus TaxID=257438 RepID=A0AAP9JIJ3_GLUTH|nr:N-formylglutamate amidohydrolase [Gluconobacter thailandicus]QEH97338.1 N-formylglutamate deformylase [Gluconobacter thailandicus]
MTTLSPYPAVIIKKPQKTAVPIVVSSPHSGEKYFPDFLETTRLSLRELQQTEDRFVDRLFERAPEMGGTLLTTEFPRVWCDVNRDCRELDSGMFRPTLLNEGLLRSAKVRAGFGVIPRCASQSRAIYTHCLPAEEVHRRLQLGWLPYHEALNQLLEGLRQRFGVVILLEAHSMPRLPQARACDMVIGDVHGKSCSPDLTEAVERYLLQLGYEVRRNVPYAGGYITSHYGHPAEGIHAFQLEICRSRYLNAATLQPSRGFQQVQNDMSGLLETLACFAEERLYSAISSQVSSLS